MIKTIARAIYMALGNQEVWCYGIFSRNVFIKKTSTITLSMDM